MSDRPELVHHHHPAQREFVRQHIAKRDAEALKLVGLGLLEDFVINQFLKDEGLDDIARLRAERGQTDKPDRERFFRYAKTLLLTGATSSAESRTFGFRYEIVPRSDPWSGSPLRVQVLFDGKPLPGALVTAIHRDDPQARAYARSDPQGRATLNLPRRGVWLIKSVHMTAAPAGTNADWESSWASVTFER